MTGEIAPAARIDSLAGRGLRTLHGHQVGNTGQGLHGSGGARRGHELGAPRALAPPRPADSQLESAPAVIGAAGDGGVISCRPRRPRRRGRRTLRGPGGGVLSVPSVPPTGCGRGSVPMSGRLDDVAVVVDVRNDDELSRVTPDAVPVVGDDGSAGTPASSRYLWIEGDEDIESESMGGGDVMTRHAGGREVELLAVLVGPWLHGGRGVDGWSYLGSGSREGERCAAEEGEGMEELHVECASSGAS